MSVAVPIPGPLTQASFLERPNRFVVHARLEDGERAVAHLPDPGRLEELLVPGRRLWLRPADDPARKTRWTAVLVQTPDDDGLISIDTTLPNRLIGKSLEEGVMEEFRGWVVDRPEVTVGGSRFDFRLVPDPDADHGGREAAGAHDDRGLDGVADAGRDAGYDDERDTDCDAGDYAVRDTVLQEGGSPPSSLPEAPDPGAHDELYLEVKSVTLVEEGVGLFPDAVTARGTRHVQELAELSRRDGTAAAVCFVAQRADVRRVLAAPSIDPDFAEALEEARESGVGVLARRCHVSIRKVVLGDRVPAG